MAMFNSYVSLPNDYTVFLLPAKFYVDTSCSSAESGDECFCHTWKLVVSIPRVGFKDTLVSLVITSPFLSLKTTIQTHKFPCKSILLNTQAKNSSVSFLYLAEFLS